jgi:hypothetical protein
MSNVIETRDGCFFRSGAAIVSVGAVTVPMESTAESSASRHFASTVRDGHCFELDDGAHYLMESRAELVFTQLIST